jgi:predicted histidine transporter YuiF (NhaC family)
MRALCGSIIAAGALIGTGLAVIGFGIRFQAAGQTVRPGSNVVWGATSMTTGLWILIVGFLVGLGIAFVGLAYHHERRYRETSRSHEFATTGRSPTL